MGKLAFYLLCPLWVFLVVRLAVYLSSTTQEEGSWRNRFKREGRLFFSCKKIKRWRGFQVSHTFLGSWVVLQVLWEIWDQSLEFVLARLTPSLLINLLFCLMGRSGLLLVWVLNQMRWKSDTLIHLMFIVHLFHQTKLSVESFH